MVKHPEIMDSSGRFHPTDHFTRGKSLLHESDDPLYLANLLYSDFFCNLATMVKLCKDAAGAEHSDREYKPEFYDTFGKVQNDYSGEYDEEDLYWSDIRLSSFKLRLIFRPPVQKKQRKAPRLLFNRITDPTLSGGRNNKTCSSSVCI